MPFIIRKSSSCPKSRPYGVFTETGHQTGKSVGKPHGCFPSAAAAREQQKALYANVPDARHEPSNPPNLRKSDAASKCCATCTMYWKGTPEDVTANDAKWAATAGHGLCWGYGNHQILDTQLCDSYEPDSPAQEAKSEGNSEVSMSATVSPLLTSDSTEWRRERARALSESQRKRTENRQVHEPLELRDSKEDGKRVLRSYASLFNSPYVVRAAGMRFKENVQPGAFKRTLGTKPDVVFRTEHTGPPLAATWSGDLRLGEDDRGLWYEVDLDESDPDVKALISKVERGVYRESSFAFRVPTNGDKWNDDHSERDIVACELDRGDVSVVTFGASRATGKHMVLRSEEALIALQEVGRQQFVNAWKEYREFIALSAEERAGKVISSTTAETLRHVLGLIANADDAVDEAEAMLSDFLGVPNPDDDDHDDAQKSSDSVTSSEQLGKLGRSELWDKIKTLAEDANWSVRQDGDAVYFEAREPEEEEEEPKEGTEEESEGESEKEPEEGDEEALSEEDARAYCDGWYDEEKRRTFTADQRQKMSKSGAAMSDGSFPIANKSDLQNAIQAVGRAKNPSAAKAHIKKRAAALGLSNMIPDSWRSEVTLLENDSEDLLMDLKLRRE